MALETRLTSDSEIRHHEIEKLFCAGELRIEDKSRGNIILTQPVQQTIEQRGLTGTDFPRKQNKALATLNSVSKRRQCFLGSRRPIQVPRVGAEVEGQFFKPKEVLIHV